MGEETDHAGSAFDLEVVVAPVGLHEHGVDLLQIDGFGVVAHGFDERTRNHSPSNFPEIVLPFFAWKRSFAPEKWPIRSQHPRQAIPRCGRKTASGGFRGMAAICR